MKTITFEDLNNTNQILKFEIGKEFVLVSVFDNKTICSVQVSKRDLTKFLKTI